MTEFVNDQAKKGINNSLGSIKPGFCLAYVSLLQAIAKNDLA